MYEQFLHHLDLYMTCGRHELVGQLIDNAGGWSYAFRVGNGEMSEKAQEKLVNIKFWKLCDVKDSV